MDDGTEQEVGCIVSDLDDADEGDVGFVGVLENRRRPWKRKKKLAGEGRGQQAGGHGLTFFVLWG